MKKNYLINIGQYEFLTAQETQERTGDTTVLTEAPMQNVPSTVLSQGLQDMQSRGADNTTL